MSDPIQQCLGHRWAMFYCAQVPIHQLISVQTLHGCIEFVNRTLTRRGRSVVSWPAGDQDEIARLLWVNWIYQQLAVEPIRKPVLAHWQQSKMIVDCGDTRLMSLRLYDAQATVSAVITCDTADCDHFANWQRIHTADDLRAAAGFGSDSVVLASSADDWCMSWLEIGDQTTSHHLHSIDQRVEMIQRYLDQQCADFKFDETWVTEPIDWTQYQAS